MNGIRNLWQKKRWIFWLLLIALLCLPPLLKIFGLVKIKALYLRYACNIMMYATLAGSLNAINGYSGQTCLGQAGFFAIGAYTCAILSTRFSISFWLLLPICGFAAGLVGLLVSLPTLRLSGIYLSIVTLGASEIIRIIAQTASITGGAMGIKGIPYPWLFGLDTFRPEYYYFIFLFIGILFLFCTSRILNSRVGRAWISIREDLVAAKSLGVRTSFYKSLNFVYGAFWAGVIGCCYAPFVNFIESSQFTTDKGFDVLAMIVIGGQGTLVGPIIGSAIVTILTESLRFLGVWRYVIYALIIIAMMWLRPQGIAGDTNSILAGGKVRRRPQKKGKEARA